MEGGSVMRMHFFPPFVEVFLMRAYGDIRPESSLRLR